jgi:hypothetical protein
MRRIVGLLAGLLAGAVAGSLLVGSVLVGGAPALAATRRDPALQPFAADSIWNTPVGRSAQYVPAGLPSRAVTVDRVTVVQAVAGERPAPVLAPDCTTPARQRTLPASVQAPATPGTLVVVAGDGRAAESWTSARRCGDAIGARYAGRTRLDGDGVPTGGRVAGLPGLGGTLRAAELRGRVPVRHTLALLVPARYLAPGNRWPAVRTDGTRSTTTAGPALRVGALLALRPADAAGLTPATPLGETLVAALRDHGAYVAGVADTFRVRAEGPVEPGALRDLQAALAALAVVDDNTPDTIGGRGERRAATAAPLGRPRAAVPPPSPSPSPSPSLSSSPSAQVAAPARLPATPVAQVARRQAPPAALAVVGVLAVALLAVGLRVGRTAARAFS